MVRTELPGRRTTRGVVTVGEEVWEEKKMQALRPTRLVGLAEGGNEKETVTLKHSHQR